MLPAHLAGISINTGKGKNIITRGFGKVQEFASGILNFINYKLYAPLLKVTLRHRYAALVIFVAVALTGGWLIKMNYVRVVFFPDIPSDVITVKLEMESGSSVRMTQKNAEILESAAKEANAALMKRFATDNPPIRKVMTVVDDAEAVEIYAELQPQQERVIATKELLKEWRKLSTGLESIANIKFHGNTETGGGGFVMKVESRNGDSMEAAVKELRAALKKDRRSERCQRRFVRRRT